MPTRSATVDITGSLVEWAINEAGLTIPEAAEKARLSAESIRAWISDNASPTRVELRRLADAVHRPVALFYLPEPPTVANVPPALRRLAGADQRQLTPDQLRQVRRARRVQRLLASLLAEEGVEPTELPYFPPGHDPATVGAHVRQWLQITVDQQVAWKSAKEAFDSWRDLLESEAILVLQLQLGSVMRGFCLQDERAPLIAVNTAENYQARSFTLFHELAHLFSRTASSCSDKPGRAVDGINIERWCEEVASACVLPAEAVSDAVRKVGRRAENNFDLVRRVANELNLSLRATALALIREKFLGREIYDEVDEKAPQSDREKRGFGSGGRKAPEQRKAEFGHRSLSLIFHALNSNRLTERDARDYLRLDGAEVDSLGAEVAASH